MPSDPLNRSPVVSIATESRAITISSAPCSLCVERQRPDCTHRSPNHTSPWHPDRYSGWLPPAARVAADGALRCGAVLAFARLVDLVGAPWRVHWPPVRVGDRASASGCEPQGCARWQGRPIAQPGQQLTTAGRSRQASRSVSVRSRSCRAASASCSARCQSRAWVAAWKSRSRRWPYDMLDAAPFQHGFQSVPLPRDTRAVARLASLGDRPCVLKRLIACLG